MREGTLRLLVCLREADQFRGGAAALAWDGAPPDACWHDSTEDLDFGDYDCDNLPRFPAGERGLMVLVWPWNEVVHPDADDDGVEPTTAKYGVGHWRRPTVDELVEFGLLPAAAQPRGA